jgi:hypothetical protein
MQAGESPQDFVILEVDDAHRVVAEFCDEESLAPQIDGEVIDAAAHDTQADSFLQLERRP